MAAAAEATSAPTNVDDAMNARPALFHAVAKRTSTSATSERIGKAMLMGERSVAIFARAKYVAIVMKGEYDRP